jgi:cullin 1
LERCEELYGRLEAYLADHVHAIYCTSRGCCDKSLLEFYSCEWNRYTVAAAYIAESFQFLNAHWVKAKIDEGRRNVYAVYTLHLVMWRRLFSDRIRSSFASTILGLVERHRRGATVDISRIKNVLASFASLGSYPGLEAIPGESVFDYYFMNAFLVATRAYYKKLAESFAAEKSVSRYMEKTEAWLGWEARLWARCPPPGKEQIPRLEYLKILVLSRLKPLHDELPVLLGQQSRHDLRRMYRLLSQIDGGLGQLAAKFEEHVKEVYWAVTGGENAEQAANKEVLVRVYRKYHRLVGASFSRDARFFTALENATLMYRLNGAVSDAELAAALTERLGIMPSTWKQTAMTSQPATPNQRVTRSPGNRLLE